MKQRVLRALAASMAVILALTGCAPFDPGGPNPVSVTIRLLDLPTGVEFGSITITVAGEGMETYEGSLTLSSNEGVVQLLPGTARSFEVLATVAAADPLAAREFQASGVADVTVDGQVVELTFAMTRAAVLVPDRYNRRLVQVDDTSGSGWAEVSDTELGLVDAFFPIDADIDALGRIYVASYGFDNTYGFAQWDMGGIVQLDSIEDSTAVVIEADQGITALAVDRPRNLLYYIRNASDYWILYVQDLSDLQAAPTELEYVEFDTFGLAVDGDGFVYVTDNTNDQVIKLDPTATAGNRVVDTYSVVTPYMIWDVAVFGGYLYVMCNDPVITRIEMASGQTASLGGDYPATPADPQPGEFYGPRKFLSLAGDRFIVKDEDQFANYGRIVGFDDILGNGWEVYGEDGGGTGQFEHIEDTPPS